MERPWRGFSRRPSCWRRPKPETRGQWRYGEKAKVLIVEDEKNIVDILRFNLRKEGYDTLEAFDGVTGLRLALEESPT